MIDSPRGSWWAACVAGSMAWLLFVSGQTVVFGVAAARSRYVT